MDRTLNTLFMILLSFIWTVLSTDVSAQLRSPAEFAAAPVDSVADTRFSNSIISLPIIGAIKLYQKFISPVRGVACPMFPSCSEYSCQAISEYGILGMIKTADRLMRCGHDTQFYQIAKIGRSYRYIDQLYVATKPE